MAVRWKKNCVWHEKIQAVIKNLFKLLLSTTLKDRIFKWREATWVEQHQSCPVSTAYDIQLCYTFKYATMTMGEIILLYMYRTSYNLQKTTLEFFLPSPFTFLCSFAKPDAVFDVKKPTKKQIVVKNYILPFINETSGSTCGKAKVFVSSD